MNFIAVHAGAGFHGFNHREDYLKACREACQKGMETLKRTNNAIDGVTCAVESLEDNGITNAGFGSNLSESGTVECDASIMNGTTLNWAGVGALHGIKNPINAAKMILNEQSKPLPLGLISPNILVGDGARNWAESRGCVVSEHLFTEKSKETFNKYKRRLSEYNNDIINAKECRLDTVGAICVDLSRNVASAVSSGGIILKQSGRIGQAAVYGSGVWAQENVAIATSGVGEYLIKTLFAKECADYLLNCDDGNYVGALSCAFKERFLESPFLKNVNTDRFGGVLSLVFDKETNHTDLLWGHSTMSMCIGYMNSNENEAKAFVSDLPKTSKPGHCCIIESKSFR